MELEEFMGLYEKFRQIDGCHEVDKDLRRIYGRIQETCMTRDLTHEQAMLHIQSYRDGLERGRFGGLTNMSRVVGVIGR